jgi:hypothetical protein
VLAGWFGGICDRLVFGESWRLGLELPVRNSRQKTELFVPNRHRIAIIAAFCCFSSQRCNRWALAAIL